MATTCNSGDIMRKTVTVSLKKDGVDIELKVQDQKKQKKIKGILVVRNKSGKSLSYSNRMLKLTYNNQDTMDISTDSPASVLADYAPFKLDTTYTERIYCIPKSPIYDFQKLNLSFDTSAIHRAK